MYSLVYTDSTFDRILNNVPSAWSPCKQEDISTLERVQEKALENVPGLSGKTYDESYTETEREGKHRTWHKFEDS
jgi:hypothetical protein